MTVLNDVKLINLPSHKDDRGILTSLEQMRDVPIDIKRIFYMHQVSANRGGHAHIDTDQVAIATSGSFVIKLSDGKDWESYTLNDPTVGLYIPRMVFVDIDDLSADSVCLVLANTFYDINKSLRSWEDYLGAIK